jgi:REP element-mobilizing transposase RayT
MRARRDRKRHIQLSLDQARKPDGKHGGWRPNAGRPRKPGTVSHATRASLNPRHPEHVTLRMAPGVGSIARDWLMTRLRACVREAHNPTFRIVEFNVLSNHLHLIVEAASKDALSRGIQGFAVRVARRMNSALKRSGMFFAHRYHARALTNPTQVRHALRYVLQNRKHHAAEKRFSKTWFDPYSSAAWFDGWATQLRASMLWQQELLEMPRPTAKPTTWLLSTGWKRLGLLRLDEAPA